MYRFLLFIALALSVVSGTLSAAQTRTYPDALKKAKNKPVVLFCYGANFDEENKKKYEQFFKSRDKSLIKVLNREIYVVIPVYQLPDDHEKKERDKVMGGRGLPGGIWSFPCLAVVDGSGTLRGVVQSSEDLETPEKAAKALSELLDSFSIQQKLLEKIAKASGSHKEKLTREMLSISNLRIPKRALFDPSQNGVVEKLQVMTLEGANTYIRYLLSRGLYTAIERQMILAAYAGHVRRNNGPTPRLRAIYTEMRNIDPKSIYGAYAEGAIELWVVPKEQEKAKKPEVKQEEAKAE